MPASVHNNAPAEISWESVAAALFVHLDAMPQDVHGEYQLTDALRKTFASLVDKDWDTTRSLYTFAQLPAEKLIPLCREDTVVSWWTAITAHAFAGNLEGIQKLHAACREDVGNGETPNMSTTLSWLSHPLKLKPDTPNKIRPEVLDHLMQWGADPNNDNGKWLMMALRTLETDQLRPFVKHGADLLYIGRVLQTARKNGQETIIQNITGALSGNVFYNKIDDDSLQETRFLPGLSGLSALKTLFNFQSRRVIEIHEGGAPEATVQTSTSFAEFETDVLQAAAERLKELGGRADAYARLLDKPPRPKKSLLTR